MAFDYTKYNDWGKQVIRLKTLQLFNLPFLADDTDDMMLVVKPGGDVDSQPIPSGGGGGGGGSIELSFDNIWI